MKDAKLISRTELEKSNDTSVWVLNNSNPRGIINFQVNDGMGNTITVVIPITWMPVDLTTQATKMSLITNPQFRRLVSGDMLQLVDPDFALSVAESPQGKKEMQRLFTMEATGTSEENIPDELKQETQTKGVSGFILNIVARTDTDEDTVMSALKGQESALSKDDFKYIAENSQYPQVKSWAAEHLM